MLGSYWSRVTAGIAVLVGIAGLSYVLAGAAAPPAGPAALVEFTPDGKLKKPEGYRKWMYSGPAFEVRPAGCVRDGTVPDTPTSRGNHTMNTKVLRWVTPGCLAATTLVAATLAPGVSHPDDPLGRAASDFSPYVSKEGGISLPTDYRDRFMHLGTWAVASKSNQPVHEMHNVYARAEDVRAYRRKGKFPDGAVLVKEITNVGSDKLTTGQSTWSTNIKIWFVMVKDAKGRFPGNDLWGEGWGWALFEAKDPKRNVATDFRTDCKTCHIPARKDDWVYIRGYPILGDRTPAR